MNNENRIFTGVVKHADDCLDQDEIVKKFVMNRLRTRNRNQSRRILQSDAPAIAHFCESDRETRNDLVQDGVLENVR